MIFAIPRKNKNIILKFDTEIQSEVEDMMILLGYNDYVLDNKLNDDDSNRVIIEVKIWLETRIK